MRRRKRNQKEGKVTMHWTTGSGVSKKGVFKVGAVSRTLISVDRLQETGHHVILTKNQSSAHHQHEDRRSDASQEKQRHVHLGHVDVDSDE